MSIALVYKPKDLLKKMKQWVAINDEVGSKLYARVQDAEHLGAERIIIGQEEADYLVRKFLD